MMLIQSSSAYVNGTKDWLQWFQVL